MATLLHSKKRVCYYYDGNIGNYYYGQGYPMKPHIIRIAHNLILNYGLYKQMEIYRPPKATHEEMTKFHSDDYIKFLRNITPDNLSEYSKQMKTFHVGEDCPVFDGMYEFCQLSAGGSIAGTVKLNKRQLTLLSIGLEDFTMPKCQKPQGFVMSMTLCLPFWNFSNIIS